jgi:5,10-methylenetetrahydromethanopterin reductase
MRIDVILDPDTSPAEARELGQLAERHGIHAVWASNYPSSRDPFMTLAPLALASSRILMGPLVMTPWELHPLKMSKAILGLAELSGGRAQILVGGPTGVPAAMGIDPVRMVGHVRECVEILKGTRPDAALNYQGRIFRVFNYRPAWATARPPTIWIGANKPQMLAMATRLADAIMFGDITPATLHAALGRVDAGLAAAGRSRADLRLSALVAWHVKSNAQASVDEAREQLALRGMLEPSYLASFLDEEECAIVQAHLPAFFRAYKRRTPVIEGVPETILTKLVDHLTCSGGPDSAERHIARLKDFRAAGLTDIALKLHRDQAAAIEMIGTRVVPALG